VSVKRTGGRRRIQMIDDLVEQRNNRDLKKAAEFGETIINLVKKKKPA